MSKAFDKVYHSAILTALDKNSCRLSAQSVYREHAQTKLRECEPWKRGVPQGAPESPFLFILVTEMALASLHDSWAERGLGCLIDSF